MSEMFRSMVVRNYRVWFAGALVSNIGSWMQRTAQDWIVLTELSDNDALALGIVTALQLGPSILLVPLTGLASDRLNRRHFLMITQIAMGLLAAGLALFTLSGALELWHVYVFAALLGVVSSFDVTARQTFVSELVGPERLGNAVSLNSTSFTSARLIGPAVAGALTVAVGAGWVFAIDAATFLATLFALVAIRPAELHPEPRASRERGQVLAGFRYIASQPTILLIMVMTFVIGMFGLNFSIFISTMVRLEFHRGAAQFGLLTATMAVGSVVGALTTARFERPRLRFVVAAAGSFGVLGIVAAWMPGYWSFAALLVTVGVASQILMTTANATVQLTSDPLMRGRVMSAYFAIFVGASAIGAPFIGWVANAASSRWALVVGGASGVVAFLIAALWALTTARARVLRLGRFPWWGIRIAGVDAAEPGPAPLAAPRLDANASEAAP